MLTRPLNMVRRVPSRLRSLSVPSPYPACELERPRPRSANGARPLTQFNCACTRQRRDVAIRGGPAWNKIGAAPRIRERGPDLTPDPKVSPRGRGQLTANDDAA